jgi:hypothetical protein
MGIKEILDEAKVELAVETIDGPWCVYFYQDTDKPSDVLVIGPFFHAEDAFAFAETRKEQAAFAAETVIGAAGIEKYGQIHFDVKPLYSS